MAAPSRSRRFVLWATPLIVALFAAAYSIDHHQRTAPMGATSPRAEALPRGTGAITGTLLGPDGSPVDDPTDVHLVTETWLAAHNPATWRCCRDCELALFDAYCELSADVVARLFTRGELDVMPARTARTDDGDFTFDELPPGLYAVFAAAPRGTLAVAREVLVPERGDAHVVLESHFASSLAGTVLSAETARAVEGASVVLVDPRVGRSHVAKTDAEGRFVVAGLDPDVGYQLTALAEDFAPSERSNLWVGEDEELVELEVGATVSGLVKRGGEPAADVVVDLDDGIDGTVTGKSGRFTFTRLSPGIHVVRAATRDGLGARVEVELSAGEAVDQTVELEPVRAIEVLVVDTATRALTGVDVRLRTPRAQERRLERTGEDGRAIFDLVAIGAIELEVKRADLGATSTTATITAGAGAQRIVARLEGTAGVRGRIDDGRGRPVADVELVLEHLSPTSDSGDDVPRGGRTDASGAFAIPSLAPGAWELVAKKPGYITARTTFDVDDRDVPAVLDLELVEGGQIRGQVLDPDGRGQAGWIVRATPKYPSDEARELAPDDLSQWTVSDRTGSFVLVGLEPGPHVLSARPAPTSSRRSFEAAVTETAAIDAPTGTNDAVLRTPGTGTLEGRVRFGGGVAPEAIEVTVPGAGVRSFDGHAGRFTFDDAPAGTYAIRVRAPGFGAEAHRVTVTRGEI
ncbi:carboxypeptidase-like regulatory domain-containing protein, partial [Myxococcota bacterium]|nr:carboxypeptidase-like regulatory domain-containing protein [Myxococcota bacterium]